MTRLALRFLGNLQVTLDQQPITRFRATNNQGLLAYLALQNERQHPREVLATLFWPEESDRNGRNNLRQALYQLRKLVGDLDEPERPYLLVTRRDVQFNPESEYALDVRQFLQAIQGRDLETAVSLYHGDLLPGFTCDSAPFEGWLRGEREGLHQLALEAMSEVTREHLRSGRLDEAQALARRQLSLEPWREPAYRQLMRAYALAGDRANALAHFETCREQLLTELGVEPTPETIALAEDIKAGRIAPIASDEVIQPPAKVRHNLPAETTSLIGRELELSQISRLLNHEGQRLVTIVGPGGMGKTRLALATGSDLLDRFQDGVYFVDLAPLSQAADIPEAVAAALDYQAPDQSQDLFPQLLGSLRQAQLLLILDNFEHLLPGAKLVNELLQACPQLAILVTSRQRLNLASESSFELGGLGFPEVVTSEAAITYTAVQLFLDSGRRNKSDFALTPDNVSDVVRICQLVQGMPLGLMLAAAWLELLAPAEIAAEIERSLDFLVAELADLPPRQRSLQAVFERSWELMTLAEQAVMAKLSVFRGGCTREAAEQVAGADLRVLLSLVNKSLLQRQADSGRLNMHELLRQFAAQKRRQLDVGDEAGMAHCSYFARLMAKEARFQLYYFPIHVPRQYAADRDNIRRAWDYALDHGLPNELSSLVRGVAEFSHAQGIQTGRIPRLAMGVLKERGLPDTDPAMLHLRLTELSALVDIEDPAWVRRHLLELVSLLEEGGELELLLWAYERLAWMSAVDPSDQLGLSKWSDQITKTALEMGDELFIKFAEVHRLWSRSTIGIQADRTHLEDLMSYFEPDYSNSAIYFTLLLLLGEHYSAIEEYEKAVHFHRRKLNMAKRWQHLFFIGGSATELARVYLKMGQQGRAGSVLLEAVEWHLAIGQEWQTLGVLWGTAADFQQIMGDDLVVQTLSMVYHHPEAIQFYRWAIEERRSRFEAEMGAEAFAAAWERGKVMGFETAVARVRSTLASAGPGGEAAP